MQNVAQRLMTTLHSKRKIEYRQNKREWKIKSKKYDQNKSGLVLHMIMALNESMASTVHLRTSEYCPYNIAAARANTA